MRKKIFITGIAGFIGFHSALYFHQKGYAVQGLDNFNDYYDPRLKRERCAQLALLGISVIEADLQDFATLKKTIENFAPTHLLHLAAQAGVRYSLLNPGAYIESNIAGFLNILEICRLHPHIPLIYASSSSVYGLNQKIPFSIEDRTDQPANLYGVTKKTNELMASSYHHLFGIQATGLRFFTVYGPWGRPDMAYFSFTRAILEERPIEIYNEGCMERDFTYIDDIVEGIGAAIDKSLPLAVFNLGNNKSEPLLKLVELIEQEVGKKAIKIFRPMQKGDIVATYADIAESQQKLGFFPKVSLEEGISRFVRWFRNY